MHYLISDTASLARLQQRTLPAGTTQLTLSGPFADDDLQRTLNSAYFACGCEEGSVAVLLALSVSVFGAATTGLDGSFAWWRIAGYLAVAALGGKGVGLALARVRLRRVLRRLSAISDHATQGASPDVVVHG